ncbi:MAG: ATP-binding protein [Asticcacaulis sp.]|uniref:ATP-binding protein n=1 Tax=Asticcacaulis sp. TaxID=1872648 RepID=UPI0039E6C021
MSFILPDADTSTRHSAWYTQAMERLIEVVQALSQARDIDTISRITRDAARELTGADGATFVLRDGDKCFYADENAIEPLWKGKRFPMEMCISGWVMLNAQAVKIEDIYADARIPAEAYRPTFVKSLAMVPIRKIAPIGAIGNYWAYNYQPTDEQMAVLQALANTTAVALENARLIEELRDKVDTLQRQQAQIRVQHESLEVFTHALAHDLKEPVRTVRAFSEMIVANPDAPELNAGYFDFIRHAADRMAMLVDTVFNYTQLHDPSRTIKSDCEMDTALADAENNLRQLITEHDALVMASPLPVVSAQPSHMMQVLQNLIGNAVKHSPDGVKVEVSAQDRGDHWQFSVRDNGPGIEAADLKRIFEPFKRLNLNEEGAGLGLAICSKIISLHGGRLWCESAPGEGASFMFTLPKPGRDTGPKTGSETMAANDDATEITEKSATTSLARVLLVDDREADLELTRVFLRIRDKMESELSVARSAKEALTLMRQARADGTPYDLILLDINMPGMDGFEMLRALRGENDHTAVVMCTGSTYDRDVEQARELGAAGYMVKPASLAQLRPMVDNIPALRWQDEGAAARLVRAAA